MSTAEIVGLGAAAGFTIYIGLPIGRLRHPAPRLRAFLTAAAIGVLIFLFWDVVSHAVEPMTNAIDKKDWSTFAPLATLGATGFAVGLLSMVWYDAFSIRRAKSRASIGPGTAAVEEFSARVDVAAGARRLAYVIAIGIGLHNFAEGLAIGQSAARGEITLALVLVIGFGLHNATEGFGIMAPLAGAHERPSWPLIALLGFIGGGPTFFGTLVGQAYTSDLMSVTFLTLAAGSILYVVLELVRISSRFGKQTMVMYGVLVGLFAGFATDFLLDALGA